MSFFITLLALYIFSDPKFIDATIPQSFINKDKTIDPILFKMNESLKETSVYEFDQAAKKQYTAILEAACHGIQFKATWKEGKTITISDEIIKKAMKSNNLRILK